MNYVLDTDTIIYLLKGMPSITERIASISMGEINTTIINHAELLFGAYNSTRKQQNLKKAEMFLHNIKILPFCEQASTIFAEQKAWLKKHGTLMADLDLMIASITLRHEMVLVTNNRRHFERLKNLQLENWA